MLAMEYNRNNNNNGKNYNEEPYPPEIWNNLYYLSTSTESVPPPNPEPVHQLLHIPDYFESMTQLYRCDHCGEYIPFNPRPPQPPSIPVTSHQYLPLYYPSFTFQDPLTNGFQNSLPPSVQTQQQPPNPPKINFREVSFRSSSTLLTQSSDIHS